MLNPEQQRLVLQAIDDGPKPHTTLKVWQAVISFIAFDRKGEIMANRETLGEVARVTPQEVSRALTRLSAIGALERIKPGRYRINPHVGWSGSLTKRQVAAKDRSPVQPGPPPPGPLLTLMEGGKP